MARPPKPGVDTLGGRLLSAIEKSEYSNRGFARAMAERGVRGAHYRTLINYIYGRSEPSWEYLTVAGELLEVSPFWLLHGRTPAGISARQDGVRWRRGEDEPHERSIQQGFGAAIPRAWTGWPNALELRRLWWFYRWVHKREDEAPLPDEALISREVGEALAAPLGALGVDPNDLSHTDRLDFLDAQVAVLLIQVRKWTRWLEADEPEDAGVLFAGTLPSRSPDAARGSRLTEDVGEPTYDTDGEEED